MVTLPSSSTRSGRGERIVVAAILLLAAGLRLFDLGKESYWLDEAFSVSIAKTTLRHIVDETSLDVHPPLYYFVLYYWVHALDASEATVRLLSTLFNLSALLVAYGLGRRLLGVRAALIALLVLAASRFQIEFSQEARMYTLLALLGGVSTWCLVRHLELDVEARRGWRGRAWQCAYVGAVIAMTYTHAYSAFVIAGHAITVVIEARARGRTGVRILGEWVFAQLLVVAAYLPWFAIFAGQFSLVQRGFWIPETRAYMIGWPLLTYAGSIALALVYVPFAAWGLVTSHRRASPARPSPLAVLVPWLLAPIVLPLVLSFIGSPIFLPKYTIAASLPFALLIGGGLATLPTQWLVLVLVLVAGLTTSRPLDRTTAALVDRLAPSGDLRKVLTGGSLPGYYTARRKDGWRDAVWNIEAAARPGDAVLFYPFFNQIPYDLYHRREDVLEEPYPKHAALLTRTTLTTMTREMVRPHARVWFVILQQEEVKPLLVAELERTFPRVTRIREWHIDVYLCERDATETAADRH